MAYQISAIKFTKCTRSHDFLRSSLRIASKANQSGCAILSHDFSKCPSMEPGNKVEVLHRRDRRKISPGVSASIGGDVRWRSNSPRSAYKIARCVAGLRGMFWFQIEKNSILFVLPLIVEWTEYSLLRIRGIPFCWGDFQVNRKKVKLCFFGKLIFCRLYYSWTGINIARIAPKQEIPFGKANGTQHSLFKSPEIMGSGLLVFFLWLTWVYFLKLQQNYRTLVMINNAPLRKAYLAICSVACKLDCTSNWSKIYIPILKNVLFPKQGKFLPQR